MSAYTENNERTVVNYNGQVIMLSSNRPYSYQQ